MKTGLKWVFSIVVVFVLLPLSGVADDSCGHPGNLTQNCNFDRFVDQSSEGATRIVPEAWAFWVVMGNPAFDIDDHGSAPGAPAQRIWSDGGQWTAGLYQQVTAVQGKAYQARIDWAAPSVPDIERRVGIDPYGGTDPLSPQVIWGASSWEVVRMPDLHVSAFARASTVTVFVWTHHPVSHGADEVFLDAVTLVEDPTLDAPTAVPSPTPTARPPTRTPSPVPPTDTATPLPPSPVSTDTATPILPTETATETPTPTPLPPTATPTPLPPTEPPTPTWTPTATPVTIARAAFTATALPAARLASSSGTGGRPAPVLLYVAGAALIGAILLGAVLVVVWARGRRAVDGESR